MTHAELVQRAVGWLRSQGCWVVVTRGSLHVPEIPDALGWNGRGWSVLVEAKASRSDFRADQRKAHRQGKGLGNQRWYLTPPGLVWPEDVPAGWGLLEAHPAGISAPGVGVVKEAPRRTIKDATGEIRLLLARAMGGACLPSNWVIDAGMGI